MTIATQAEALEAQIPILQAEHDALRRQYGYFKNRQAWLLMLAIEEQVQCMERAAVNLGRLSEGAVELEKARAALGGQ